MLPLRAASTGFLRCSRAVFGSTVLGRSAQTVPSRCAVARRSEAVHMIFRSNASEATAAAAAETVELPGNLEIEDLDLLLEEPVGTFDDTLLLREDLSEKVLQITFLECDGEDEDFDEEEEEEEDEGEDDDEEEDDLSANTATVTLDNSVFGVPIRRDIVHRVVLWQRAGWRNGTAHTKTRAEVSGGGRKPWRQKGTGRARHGSIRSPLWRGGGKAHGKKQRDFSFKLNKKVRKMGMRVALAAKWREGNLFIVNVDGYKSHKTRDFVNTLHDHGFYEDDGNLLMIDSDDPNPWVATGSNNVPWAKSTMQREANVYDILKYHRLMITTDAIETLTARCAP